MVKQYREKRWNLPFEITANNQSMTRYPTKAAEKKPIMSGNREICPKSSILIIWRSAAPNKAGIAMKKANLAASWCFIPIRMATEIVIPEREIPGNNAQA